MRQQWADYRVFWREFRRAYHTTGAVLPSGEALSRALSRFVRVAAPAGSNVGDNCESMPGRRILEVGPGTGAVTAQIIHDMRPDDCLTLVERNEQFVARLRERFNNDSAFGRVAGRVTFVHGAVEELPEDEPYDLIISGLPLNNFPAELVEQILDKLRWLLAAGGTLSFFEYVAIRRAKALVSGRAERKRLRDVGRALHVTLAGAEICRDLVLANVPPAWVHHVRFTDHASRELVAEATSPKGGGSSIDEHSHN